MSDLLFNPSRTPAACHLFYSFLKEMNKVLLSTKGAKDQQARCAL
jgi:hypothetical protein